MALSRLCDCVPGKFFRWKLGRYTQLFTRLERQGWVRSEWKQSESKQRARYYRIMANGKKPLASDLSKWERIVDAIGSIMHGRPEESET